MKLTQHDPECVCQECRNGAWGRVMRSKSDTPINQLKSAVTALESRVAQIEGMLRPTEVSAKEWGVKLTKETS